MQKRIVLYVFVECQDIDSLEKKVPVRHKFNVYYESFML